MKHLGGRPSVDRLRAGHHLVVRRAAAPRKDHHLGPLADHHRDHPVAHLRGLLQDRHLGHLHPMHSEVLIQNQSRTLNLNLNRLKMQLQRNVDRLAADHQDVEDHLRVDHLRRVEPLTVVEPAAMNHEFVFPRVPFSRDFRFTG